MHLNLLAVAVITATALSACGKKNAAPTPPKTTEAPATQAAAPTGRTQGHHGGPIIELGTVTAGPYTFRVTRDSGDVVAGGEVPIDVWVMAGPKDIAAMRFWVGTEDAAGTMKVLAPLERENYHTHAVAPDPMPADSRAWIEIETDGGATHVASVALD